MKLDLISELGNKFGTLFIFAFVLSRLQSFRNLVAKKPVNMSDKILLSLVFGVFGIFGTYFSVEYSGGLINTRIIGVATGGLLGGPMVGLMSGIVAGLHRGFISNGEFTSFACSISTVFEGLMAGLMGGAIRNKKNKWVYAAITGGIAELMRKVSVLIFSKPFESAVEFVSNVWLPMVIINSVGLALLFMIIESIFKDQEKIVADQASLTLETVDKALPFFKNGLCSDNIRKVAKIIYEMTEFDAVKITEPGRVIAFAGSEVGENDGYTYENSDYVIKTGESIVINESRDPKDPKKETNSLMILPLKESGKNIGTLELYKKLPNSMTAINIEVGNGLARLFSTQLTLGKLEYNSKLLAKAELEALQAQINPHFLFNSLTVIASLCRMDVEKSRDMIIHLSNFYRKTLNVSKEMVDLETEINHVKSYVYIEMARFEDKLKIDYDIPKTLNCFLPPLTLQPIVENAIKHGILPKKSGGIIKVTGYKKENNVYLEIFDNGVGMDENRLEELLSGKIRQTDSIGFKNVDMRLKKIFGENHGIVIKSKKGEGTTVNLCIPLANS